ncbi:MAG: hypothetical protein DRO12_05425 [Thermoprotei archaeon]|nr:MAG: hypothetical protein DRO12_05425 [Thermoprotei archaeon]
MRRQRELLARCARFLHLGISESFRIPIAEAMASGCIPIAHRSGAIPEYLPKKLTYMHPEEAVQKIVQIINNPNRTELKKLRREPRGKSTALRRECIWKEVYGYIQPCCKKKLGRDPS